MAVADEVEGSLGADAACTGADRVENPGLAQTVGGSGRNLHSFDLMTVKAADVDYKG